MKIKFLAPTLLAAMVLFCSCQRKTACPAYKVSKHEPLIKPTFLTDKRK